MNTYDTIDELWIDAADQVFTEGHTTPSRDGHTTEILGFVGRLADPTACFMLNPVRKLNPSYAAAELLWYLSGTSDIERIKAYAPQYERFAEGGQFAFGAYGARWCYDPAFEDAKATKGFQDLEQDNFFNYHFRGLSLRSINQIYLAAWLLSRKQDSRQVVVSMWNAGDLPHATLGDKKDLPCTLSLQFMVRDGRLFLTATMRSNDLWLGLPYDIWAFCSLQIILADVLGLELGWYQHQAMSLHVYDRNEEKARKAIEPEPFSADGLTYEPLTIGLHEAVTKALELEEFQRKNGVGAGDGVKEWVGERSWLGQALVLAGHKWWPKRAALTKIRSKVLRDYVNIHYTDKLPIPELAEGSSGCMGVPEHERC